MRTSPCCSFSALLPGAEPFPRYSSEWFFLYRSQSSNGNGIPSSLVGPFNIPLQTMCLRILIQKSRPDFINETYFTLSVFNRERG